MAAVRPKAGHRAAEKMQRKEVARAIVIDPLNLKHTLWQRGIDYSATSVI
jgi:hypothetical protein